MSKVRFKKITKEKVRSAAFKDLLLRKNSYSQVKDNCYNKFTLQHYLSSETFTLKEKHMLFKLRIRMLDVKANCPSLYVNDMQCEHCVSNEAQTQRHLLENCDKIIANSKTIFDNISVDHLFGHLSQQLNATKLFIEIQAVREQLKPH